MVAEPESAMRCWPPLRPADVDAHPPQPTLLDLAGEAPPPLVVDLLLGDARELVERLLCALGGPHGGQFPDPSNAVARERSIARGDSSPLADRGWTRLLRRKPQGRKIGSDNRRSGESARLDCFAVIRFRQRPARNVPTVVSRRSE